MRRISEKNARELTVSRWNLLSEAGDTIYRKYDTCRGWVRGWRVEHGRQCGRKELGTVCSVGRATGVKTANMDTSPTLSIGGSRARAALLTTSGTGTGSTDRRVVFLASQPTVGGSHETKTWPHHWSPHTF
ncbi:unnamed protein product [Xylocopa violacea]|uniref:Uncharacterized protein n=1 Tax=Xylocopa violacea TaxID=135666 RepID=A0ABP1N6S8_XYLVO